MNYVKLADEIHFEFIHSNETFVPEALASSRKLYQTLFGKTLIRWLLKQKQITN